MKTVTSIQLLLTILLIGMSVQADTPECKYIKSGKELLQKYEIN